MGHWISGRRRSSKSCVLNAPELARYLGFQHAQGAKFLGAWIGSDEDSKSFLQKQLDRSLPFFNSVTSLSPEYAIPVLSKCGVPRASYLLRTHAPSITTEFAEQFDTMVLRSFSAITHITRLDDEQKTCVHLPIAVGGVGITSMKIIAPFAYAASQVDDFRSQQTMTRDRNTTLLEALPEQLQQHLKWGRRASWILALRPNPYYCSAIKHHILWNSTTDQVDLKCHCGLSCKPKQLAIHALGCTRLVGINVSSRHAVVKAAIIAFCKRNAIPVSDEPVVMKDRQITRRVDVRIALPSEDVYLDIVIPNAQCKSHSSKTLAALEREKTNEKEAKYLQYVQSMGGRFVSFVVESRGTFGAAAKELSKLLMRHAILKRERLVSDIEVALARTNGAILTNVFRETMC